MLSNPWAMAIVGFVVGVLVGVAAIIWIIGRLIEPDPDTLPPGGWS